MARLPREFPTSELEGSRLPTFPWLAHPLELLFEDVRRHEGPLERVESQTARVVLVVPASIVYSCET